MIADTAKILFMTFIREDDDNCHFISMNNLATCTLKSKTLNQTLLLITKFYKYEHSK